jgi:hypothetical protein
MKHVATVLTQNTPFLDPVQNALHIDASLQIALRNLAQLKVLHRHLAHKLEIILKLLPLTLMVVIEFHPRDTGLAGWTHAEAAHASAVEIQCAVGEEVQEQAVVELGRVDDVAAVVAGILDVIEDGGVQDGEGAVCVLAVEALLVAVDHGLPVEGAGVGDAAAMGETREVVAVEQRFEVGEVGVERRCSRGDGGEEKAGWGEVGGEWEGLCGNGCWRL